MSYCNSSFVLLQKKNFSKFNCEKINNFAFCFETEMVTLVGEEMESDVE